MNLMFRTFIANKDIHPDGKLGFDKFLKFCKEVGTEPIIHFNIYTENSSEPAEFVKYMKKLDIISVNMECSVVKIMLLIKILLDFQWC